MKASMMLASQQIATKIRKDKKAATLVAQQEQMAPLADGNDLELPPDVLDDGEILAEAPAEPAAVVEKRRLGRRCRLVLRKLPVPKEEGASSRG